MQCRVFFRVLFLVHSYHLQQQQQQHLPAGWVWVGGPGCSHPQICESYHQQIINLSDPCILTVGEECANDEDWLCHSVYLVPGKTKKYTKSWVFPSPTCALQHKPDCEAYFCSGPLSTPTFSSGHHIIKVDGIELSRRNSVLRFSFTLRFMPQKLSICRRRMLLREREKGNIWSILRLSVCIDLSI